MSHLNPMLLCQSCNIMSVKPYECTTCGFLTCVQCLKNKICSVCNKTCIFKEAKLAERIIRKIETECPDCKKTLTFGALEDHKFHCHMRIYECNRKCGFKGKKADLIEHIQIRHESDILTVFSKEGNRHKEERTIQRIHSKSEFTVSSRSEKKSDSKSTVSKVNVKKNGKDCIVF